MKTIYGFALSLLLITSSAFASEHGAKIVDEAFAKAVNANDAKAIAELYTPDAVAYYPEGEFKGKEAIQKNWADFFNTFKVQDFKMTGDYSTSGNMSLSWGMWSMKVTSKKDGKEEEMKGRFTEVAKKVGGKWRLSVDHASVALPAQPGDAKAGEK